MLFTYLRYFLFLSFCLAGQFVNAKNSLYFKHLTTEEGLSNSSVLSILQDSKGFMWLGTRDGLNRYDGKRVTVYKDFFSKNPKGANVKINCIVEDERGNLLIGTNNGLYHYDMRKDVFTLGIKNYITTIFKDQKKRVWIGTTEGFYLLREFKENNLSLTYVVYSGPGSSAFTNVQTVVEDKAGQLVLGTGDGLFLLKISDSGVINVKREKILEGINIITLCRDSVQNIWAGSNKSGLFKINPGFAAIDNYTSGYSQKNILDNNVRRVIADSKGNVWIGTLKGLNKFDAGHDKFDFWIHDQAKFNSLNYNSISLAS